MLATEERERSSIWSTTAGLFAGVRTEAARASAREAPLDVDEFLAGPHQLHVVAPSRHQAVTIPLVVGLIEEVVHATYDRHDEGARLLLALDELANVAPLPRLAGIVSEGGGQGVLTLACLQDLSQARSSLGHLGRGLPLALSRRRSSCPGIADRTDARDCCATSRDDQLVRTPERPARPRGRAAGHAPVGSSATDATVSDLAHGRPGYALGLGRAASRSKWVELTPGAPSTRVSSPTWSVPSRAARSRER